MASIPMCLLLLVDRSEPGTPRVLLGRKKTGLGTGKIVGPGGHVEAGEDARAAAVRELVEETGVGVDPADAHAVATVGHRFPHRPAWDQHVEVFLAERWAGRPQPSDELDPAWYPVDALPLEFMWDDARRWLPRVLAGERIVAEFAFGPDNETVSSAAVRAAGALGQR